MVDAEGTTMPWQGLTVEAFFALPELPLGSYGITPLTSRHESMGWSRDGVWWVGVVHEGQRYRRQG